MVVPLSLARSTISSECVPSLNECIDNGSVHERFRRTNKNGKRQKISGLISLFSIFLSFPKINFQVIFHFGILPFTISSELQYPPGGHSIKQFRKMSAFRWNKLNERRSTQLADCSIRFIWRNWHLSLIYQTFFIRLFCLSVCLCFLARPLRVLDIYICITIRTSSNLFDSSIG